MRESENMSQRKKDVLRAVVSNYIVTAEPVGSTTLANGVFPTVSSATIRSVMAELEEMGLLTHPHTSAGRIPTEKGFRAYVDHLMSPMTVPTRERKEIERACITQKNDISDLLKDVSRILSSMSHLTGLAVFPKLTDPTLKHIEFMKLKGNQVLVVIVSQAGTVQNRLIDLEEELKQGDLDRMSNYLNDLFSGLTIREIKLRLLEEMREERNLYDRMLKKALSLGRELLGQADPDARDMVIEGHSRLFEHPEFLDIGRMKEIFRAFEEKSHIIKLLDKSLEAGGLNIYIGCETGASELRGCSLITATYGGHGSVMGSLGVIGPVRMDYSRAISLVEYTAKMVEKMLKEGK